MLPHIFIVLYETPLKENLFKLKYFNIKPAFFTTQNFSLNKSITKLRIFKYKYPKEWY